MGENVSLDMSNKSEFTLLSHAWWAQFTLVLWLYNAKIVALNERMVHLINTIYVFKVFVLSYE